jgi:hypothetical protein
MQCGKLRRPIARQCSSAKRHRPSRPDDRRYAPARMQNFCVSYSCMVISKQAPLPTAIESFNAFTRGHRTGVFIDCMVKMGHKHKLKPDTIVDRAS